MRSASLGSPVRGLLFGCGLAILASGCTIEPPEGTPPAPMAGVLESGPRETRFGRTGDEVVSNAQLRDKIRTLFGADWNPGTGKIQRGASAYFGRVTSPRGVRVGDKNYVAVTGCVTTACPAERVLLLIQETGDSMLARLDEGGYSHYYAYGPEWGVAGSTQQATDAALRALSRNGDPYPRA